MKKFATIATLLSLVLISTSCANGTSQEELEALYYNMQTAQSSESAEEVIETQEITTEATVETSVASEEITNNNTTTPEVSTTTPTETTTSQTEEVPEYTAISMIGKTIPEIEAMTGIVFDEPFLDYNSGNAMYKSEKLPYTVYTSAKCNNTSEGYDFYVDNTEQVFMVYLNRKEGYATSRIKAGISYGELKDIYGEDFFITKPDTSFANYSELSLLANDLTKITFYWDMDCVKHEDLPCYSISITNDNYSNCWYDNYNIFGY